MKDLKTDLKTQALWRQKKTVRDMMQQPKCLFKCV